MVHLQTTMKFFSARCQQLYIYKGEKWQSQYCIVMYNKQSFTWPLILSVQARAEQEHGTTVRKSVYIQLNEDHTFPSLNNYQYAKPTFSTSVWLSFLNGIQNTVGCLSDCLLAQGCPNMFLESHISNLIKHTWINVTNVFRLTKNFQASVLELVGAKLCRILALHQQDWLPLS